MEFPDLPAEARAQFESYRATADAHLLEKRYLHPKDALEYIDRLLEHLSAQVFGAAINQGWAAETVRAKLEGGLGFIVAEFVNQHRGHLVAIFPPLVSDSDKLKDSFLLTVRRSDRWRGILSRVAQLAEEQASGRPGASNDHRRWARSRDQAVVSLRAAVREMKEAGLSQMEMCERLDAQKKKTPAATRWSALSWRAAYQHWKYTSAVKKWLSKAAGAVKVTL